MRVVAVLIALAAARLRKDDPVGRVVTLLTDLKAKIEADGRTEQAIYDKYACWCEETTARKASAIEEGKEQIEQLSQSIVELNARQGTSVAELAKLKKDLAENAEAQKKAEAMRTKENAEYVMEKGQLEQGVAQLTKAVQVLGEGTTWESKEKERWNSALAETRVLTVAAGVRSALRLYTRKDREMAAGQDLSPVKSFLSNPAAWVQTKAAPHLGEYAPQSSAIQGILKQMLDDFNQNLVDGADEEKQKQTDFDSLMDTKRKDQKLLQSTLESKTTSAADDGKQLADDTTLREETQAQLKADEEFFDSLKQGCKTKADEWAARSRVRTEELGGINKAVEILSSDSAKGTFAASGSTFIQVAESAASPRKAAYNALKSAATRSRSVQLAALASRVYTTGHFDDVIKEIDSMVKLMRQEQQDDIDHRDWCEGEKNTAANKQESLSYDMEQLTNKINRLNNKKNELGNTINNTLAEMTEVELSMNESKDARNEENAAFRQAMKDDADAIELLGKAIEVLAAIYPSFLQKGPDDEPESWAGGKAEYGGRQAEGGGIVSILEMIREDVENEMKIARKEEGEAMAMYEKQRTENTMSLRALEAKKSALEQEEAAVDKTIAETEANHFDTDEAHTATEEYVEDLKPNCDWVSQTFDTRKEQRDAEIKGLQDAKSILSGAGYEEPAGLVATKAQQAKTVTTVAKKKAESDVDEQLDELDAESLKWGTSFLQRKA
jgi:hypothetical protein